MRVYFKIMAGVLTALPFVGHTQSTAPQQWVVKSNNYTKILLDIDKKYSPEFGSQQGIALYDTQISVPTLANDLADRKEKLQAISKLKAARLTEKDEFVKQDLNILISKTELGIRREIYGEQKKSAVFKRYRKRVWRFTILA